jgi:hypothetical protein
MHVKSCEKLVTYLTPSIDVVAKSKHRNSFFMRRASTSLGSLRKFKSIDVQDNFRTLDANYNNPD